MFLTPTWQAESVADMPPSLFLSLGIHGAILDLDNTLMIPRTPIIPEPIQGWLAEAKQSNFGLVVVSNNKKPSYLAQAEDLLQIPVIGFAQKPRRIYLRAGLETLQLSAEKVVVVGDRPLTDILGGIRLGAKTLWVKNLTHQTDKPLIQCLRFLESTLIK